MDRPTESLLFPLFYLRATCVAERWPYVPVETVNRSLLNSPKIYLLSSCRRIRVNSARGSVEICAFGMPCSLERTPRTPRTHLLKFERLTRCIILTFVPPHVEVRQTVVCTDTACLRKSPLSDLGIFSFGLTRRRRHYPEASTSTGHGYQVPRHRRRIQAADRNLPSRRRRTGLPLIGTRASPIILEQIPTTLCVFLTTAKWHTSALPCTTSTAASSLAAFS